MNELVILRMELRLFALELYPLIALTVTFHVWFTRNAYKGDLEVPPIGLAWVVLVGCVGVGGGPWGSALSVSVGFRALRRNNLRP